MRTKTDEKEKESLRDYRKNHFAIAIAEIRYPFLFDDEFSVSVTHNGYQWWSLSMTPEEAKQIIAMIESHLKSIQTNENSK